MKHTRRSFLVAILVMLYGLGLGHLQGGFELPFEQFTTNNTTSSPHYFEAPSNGKVYALPLADGALAGLQQIQYYTPKNAKYSALLLAPFETTLKHTFKHLVRASHKLLLMERLAQLLYPAHFFW